MPRMPTSGGFINGLKLSTTVEFKLVIENVLPDISSCEKPFFSFMLNSLIFFAISNKDLLCEFLITGTTSPSFNACCSCN